MRYLFQAILIEALFCASPVSSCAAVSNPPIVLGGTYVVLAHRPDFIIIGAQDAGGQGGGDYLMFNYPELAGEYLRSPDSQYINQFKFASEETRFAAKVEGMVRYVGDHSGDHMVGGPPAVLIIDKSKGISWYRRPAFCPEN